MKKRRWKKRDPQAAREASRYARPVPSRELIMGHLTEQGIPLDARQLADDLGVVDADDLEALRRRLNAMERDGQLVRTRRGLYGITDRMNLVRGRITGHRDGYGFLIPDEGGEDVYLSQDRMRRVLHGDRAVVRIDGVDRRGRKEGTVVEVLERANQTIVGRFFLEGRVGTVEPSNRRISQDVLVPEEHRNGAAHGQIVLVAVMEQPTRHHPPVGKIVEVLGDHMAPGMEIDIAIRAFDLPCEWPDAVQQEAAAFPAEVPEAAKGGREDLRDLPLVTIDGKDARDFDDAVYCEPHGKGWRLIVAIADVSSYVIPGSPLDDEALLRGNSVYFPDRVIPMLPEVLSNGLCSLNPDVDRLCMACELFITSTGRLSRYRFFEAVMRSHARLTYTTVAAVVADHLIQQRKRYRDLLPHLDNLYKLYQLLRDQRERRGAIDFETTETRIVFGTERKIESIVPVERNDAHRLIEECMILANVAAADFLKTHKLPVLYRVHEGPGHEKLSELREFLRELGLTLAGGEQPEPKHYARLIETVCDRPDRHLIETVLLRSLSQALYSPENVGHFGLALEAYAHFTSPIRRYPDLLVHRAIRHLLAGGDAENAVYTLEEMVHSGEHCSMTNRRADDATRDAIDWLKCEYMMDRVGEIFDGTITGVTGFGCFVELDNIYVEGLVHVTALPGDYYTHDPTHHRLIGERTRTIYQLADRVRVKVMRVDLDERKIDFDLIDDRGRVGKGTKGKKGKKGRARVAGKKPQARRKTRTKPRR